MGPLAAEGAESAEALIARLVPEVGGDGDTLADAAVRRGVASAICHVWERHPELDHTSETSPARRGIAWDILCDLYQVFFAGMVAEFLRAVVAEHIKLTAPVLIAADPEGRIADRIAKEVLKLVPSPCEESAAATEAAQAAENAQAPSQTLPGIAGSLVPLSVGKALGLITGEITGAEGAAT
ncbi:hypothetical protein ACWD33_05665 [Streptomyces xiamenensis]|uniref:hypothetical protein n=1 Tax=Streptomyces TaxID=1883 RepID=UPI0004C93DDA|nr:hypothetical protein [Streptomyces sp. NRRL F-2890]